MADKKASGKAEFETLLDTVDDATEYVKGIAYGELLEGGGGDECTIEIVFSNDSFVSAGAAAGYVPSMNKESRMLDGIEVP